MKAIFHTPYIFGSQTVFKRRYDYRYQCVGLCDQIGNKHPYHHKPLLYCEFCDRYYDIKTNNHCFCCNQNLRTRPRGKLTRKVHRY